LANIRSTDIVFDLGCGEALLLCEIVRLTGCNTAMGCDVDGDAIKYGQDHITNMGYTAQIQLNHECIGTFMQSDQFQSVTCVFVFLVPQQLSTIVPALQAFLAKKSNVVNRRVLSERYKICELTAFDQIDECAILIEQGTKTTVMDEEATTKIMTELSDSNNRGRMDYFGDGLGAAYLYSH
jgi:precorrin-6B methylase 2